MEDECRGKDVSCLFEEINEWVVMVREEKRICMYVCIGMIKREGIVAL